jgi:hypothetical protein
MIEDWKEKYILGSNLISMGKTKLNQNLVLLSFLSCGNRGMEVRGSNNNIN